MDDKKQTAYDLGIKVIATTTRNLLDGCSREERKLVVSMIFDAINKEVTEIERIGTSPFKVVLIEEDILHFAVIGE